MSDESMARELRRRPIQIGLSEALEHRLRLLIDRLNVDMARSPCFTAEDMIDADDDECLEVALLICAAAGLEESERESGLEAIAGGEIVSMEQADEMRLRRRERVERLAAGRVERHQARRDEGTQQ